MITPRSQTSQIKPNLNKNPLTISEVLVQKLISKLLCEVILLSFSDRSDILCFAIAYF